MIAVVPEWAAAPRTRVVRALVDRSTVPLVLDADALTALADDPRDWSARKSATSSSPASVRWRAWGRVGRRGQGNRIQVAAEFASGRRLYVVLKGHRTIVATPEGHVFVNPTGNAGMATGGTGDVLTGMIAAWLAQLLDAEAACRLAVFLHGAAGDLAEGSEGQVAMIATDLVAYLGDALNR